MYDAGECDLLTLSKNSHFCCYSISLHSKAHCNNSWGFFKLSWDFFSAWGLVCKAAARCWFKGSCFFCWSSIGGGACSCAFRWLWNKVRQPSLPALPTSPDLGTNAFCIWNAQPCTSSTRMETRGFRNKHWQLGTGALRARANYQRHVEYPQKRTGAFRSLKSLPLF